MSQMELFESNCSQILGRSSHVQDVVQCNEKIAAEYDVDFVVHGEWITVVVPVHCDFH